MAVKVVETLRVVVREAALGFRKNLAVVAEVGIALRAEG